MDIKELLGTIAKEGIIKLTASKPNQNTEYKKITAAKTEDGYFAEMFTQTQAFRKNMKSNEIADFLIGISKSFLQWNLWTKGVMHIILISKKGKVSYKKKQDNISDTPVSHNRKKNYLIEEGTIVPPLVDMGIFTAEGKVVRSMYDKFRQINRFIELINDEIKKKNYKEITIIDFGCGKSYLTFIVYYYLTEIMHIKANITGLDLKSDVIENCNRAAKRYGYSGLHFEVGDINGYKCEKKPDMVITLHACDTATDFALYNAVSWGAELIFSVPCCQHELNAQVKSDEFAVLTRYGIIKERMAALMTDAVRANLLQYKGYSTQVLEFIDMAHTPKNILIRAVKSNVSEKTRQKCLAEVKSLTEKFNLTPTLMKLFECE